MKKLRIAALAAIAIALSTPAKAEDISLDEIQFITNYSFAKLAAAQCPGLELVAGGDSKLASEWGVRPEIVRAVAGEGSIPGVADTVSVAVQMFKMSLAENRRAACEETASREISLGILKRK